LTKKNIITKQSPDSENEFRLLAEAMPQIVWVTRADGWNTYFNQQWVDYTGLTLEESYGHGWNKPFHPEDQQRAWDSWQNAVTNNDTYSLECRLRRYDGIYRWWLIRGVPVFDKSGNILKWFGTCTDIDDLKQAESQIQLAAERERAAEALRESVRREIERAAELAALLDAAPVAIFIAHDPDCLHITGNAAADALLRNPKGGEASLAAPGENKPSHFRAFKDGRELSIDELPAQQAARGFQVRDFEFSLVFDNGITRNVVANGTPLRDEQGQLRGSVLVMVDITERKLAEMALKEREEQHRVLADTMLQGVVHQDANGKIFSMNPAAGRILGKTCNEFLGETSESTEHHTLREDGSFFPGMEHPAMVALKTGQTVRGVVMGVFNPRLNAYRWISIDAVPIFEPGGTLASQVYTVFADITDRKKSEDALKYASELRRLALESAELGAWDYNFKTGDVFWDDLCRNQWGIQEGETFKYTAAINCIHPEDRDETDKAVKMALSKESDGKYHTELRVVWPDGSVHWIASHGRVYFESEGEQRSPVRFIGVNREITDEKRAEEKQQESKEQLALAADAGQVGMFDLNIETDELQWTQQHEIIFGYEPTDTKATTIKHTYQDWSTRVHPEDLAQVEERMRHAMKAKAPFQVEYRLIWPDGSVHWVNVTSKYYFDSKGRCMRLMGAVRDITRQKQLEESLQDYSNMLERKVTERTAELREKDQLLLQQSRLAAMGEMINNIAHQWRQPLNVVGLYIQSLLLYYDNGNLDREFLKTITDDTMKLVSHMSQTIDDFRNFFKPDKDKEEFKITQVIESAIRLVDASFQDSHIKIAKNYSDDTVAYGYPNEYSQVILNILSNAKDAILERKTENPVVSISSSMENGKSVVTISDNAGGIPEEIIFKVFDPHFSTKGPQGTGIGLFMAKNIIEKSMNGSLMVSNNEEGAVFRIEV